MDTKHFAARLRELRTAAGMSQLDLASRSGLKQNSISQLEAGNRKPTWESVIALANALGVACDDFREPPESEPPAPQRGRPPRLTEVGLSLKRRGHR
jgi:transcriptional regulator with XRE-family HTH domain